jgi:hypothetical protein
MNKFVARVNAASSVEDLRAIVNDACHSNLSHDELRELGEMIAAQTFKLTVEGSVAA